MDPTIPAPLAQIAWLLLNRFSDWQAEELLSDVSNSSIDLDTQEKLDYYCELVDLDPEVLSVLYCKQLERRQRQVLNDRIVREAAYYYNKPGASADPDFWSRQLVWTIDEAIALSFGKNPEVVSAHTLRHQNNLTADSLFAREYFRRLRTASTFISVGQLQQECTPGEMIAWFRRAGFEFWPALADAVESNGHVIADWYSEYNRLADALETATAESQQLRTWNAEWQTAFVEIEARHEAALLELDKLKHEVSGATEPVPVDLNASSGRDQDNQATIDVRRLNSALTVLYGIAVTKFDYGGNSQLAKSAVPNIAGAVQQAGVQRSDKNIRSLLQEAESYLTETGKLPSKSGK